MLGKPQSVLSCYRFAANGVFKPFGFCPLIESFCDRRGEGKSTCQMQNLRMYSNKSKGYSEYWSTVYFR